MREGRVDINNTLWPASQQFGHA